MAITVQQIPAALQTVNDLSNKLNDIRMLLGQAQELANNGWVVDVGSRFPLPLTVSVQQRQDMVAKYDDYKAQLVTIFQQLP
jgi:hypothetical protein